MNRREALATLLTTYPLIVYGRKIPRLPLPEFERLKETYSDIRFGASGGAVSISWESEPVKFFNMDAVMVPLASKEVAERYGLLPTDARTICTASR
jgi:hypothetical protein